MNLINIIPIFNILNNFIPKINTNNYPLNFNSLNNKSSYMFDNSFHKPNNIFPCSIYFQSKHVNVKQLIINYKSNNIFYRYDIYHNSIRTRCINTSSKKYIDTYEFSKDDIFSFELYLNDNLNFIINYSVLQNIQTKLFCSYNSTNNLFYINMNLYIQDISNHNFFINEFLNSI